MKARLRDEDPRIGDVRGRGAMIAVELVCPGTKMPDPKLTKEVAVAAHRVGVIVLTCGTYGNVLRFLPPLAIATICCTRRSMSSPASWRSRDDPDPVVTSAGPLDEARIAQHFGRSTPCHEQ